MPISWGPPVAGPYVGTWNAVAFGFTIDGYTLGQSFKKQVLNETDLYGDTTWDTIHRGSDCNVKYTSAIYATAATSPACPYGGPGVIFSTTLPIGSSDRDKTAKAFVLTSTANTPAAAAPATLTASLAAMSEQQDFSLLFSSKHRTVPVQLRLFPYESATTAGTGQHYSLT